MKLRNYPRLVIPKRLQPLRNLLLLALCTAGVAQGAELRPHKQMRYIMGTLCAITAYPVAGDDAKTGAAINATFDELKRIDALLSNWKPDSELMRLNAAAGRITTDGRRPEIEVSPELFDRIQVALHIAQATGGRFDPTVGPLVRAWGFLPSKANLDNRNRAIAAARGRVGWEKVSLHPDRRAIQFAVPGMEIDLGGIAKGYAAQQAANVLRDHGIERALVSLGESSVTAVGTPPGATGWPLLIRDPRDGETASAWVELRDGESLATSGTHEKTVGKGKARRSHIIDPHSGQAIGGSLSVTVLLDDAEAADALTKPFLLTPAGSGDWAKWLAAFPKASIILLAGGSEGLKQTTAGTDPERFRFRPQEAKTIHAAETH